jgi:hypothetical protein
MAERGSTVVLVPAADATVFVAPAVLVGDDTVAAVTVAAVAVAAVAVAAVTAAPAKASAMVSATLTARRAAGSN